MSTENLIQAIFAGLCLNTGILHLMIGLRNQPRDRVHLAFASVSLLFAVYSINLYFLNNALDSGSVTRFVAIDKWGVAANYLAYAALFWLIAVYTDAGRLVVPVITAGLYAAIALSNYVLPLTWVYTDIVLSGGNDPVLTLSPWYKIEGPLTLLVLLIYSAVYISRQFRNGNRSAAGALAIAVGIFTAAYAWDIFLVEYGLVPFILLQQYGFITFIVIMSLRLTGQVIEAKKQVHRLNVELERRVDERTADLKKANQDIVKARDAAQAASRAKSEFLANMSHELRTPLNAILGHTQIMSRDPSLTPEQHHGINAVSRSGEHLLTLINSVLEMSRIEAGRAVLNPAPFQLDTLISDMQIMFGDRAREKGLEFIIDKDPHLMSSIVADQGKISQILINLLGNAVRHTHKGSISLRIVSARAGKDAHHLIFEVGDTGEGIAAEDLGRIFDPFFQRDAVNQQQGGTGLGLAISRQYAQMMKGDLTVHSEVGQGSTFCLVIPFEEAEPAQRVAELSSLRRIVGIANRPREIRVLVVDDEPSNRDVVVGMLSPLGFDTREAEDGQEAMALFESWSPHLILMDIRMPVMDGIEAIEAIKSTRRGRETPIIGVSASVFKEDKDNVLKSGANEFIAKPIQEAELLEKIGRCLQVDYLFEEVNRPGAERLETATLTGDRLAVLPTALVERMRAAVQGGYIERLAELAKSTAANHPELSQQLLYLVDHDDYEALYRLFPEKDNKAGETDR